MPFQRFELKQSPLTYRAAPTELGAAPELSVRVDDIAWTARDTMYDASRKERAFTLTRDEQGRNFVQFGDGAHGARLPSGINNVRARYRKGLGAVGNVGAESLTQLTQRPLGLKGVSNPLSAAGGTDPEPASQARQSMPLVTRTLGRAVSLLDYEDFARAFAGVAKARAQVLRLASGPVIAITIAGADGAMIAPDSPVWRNLCAALATGGDPHVAVRLLAHAPATFRLGLKVRRDPAYELATVLAAVESALRARFGFSSRALGQPVQQSDVIATAQGVPGVVAVDLDYLYGGTVPASQTVRSRQTRLLANRMRIASGVVLPDELLTLAPDAFDRLEEMP
jgi:predicted phage baseplate assembly protein